MRMKDSRQATGSGSAQIPFFLLVAFSEGVCQSGRTQSREPPLLQGSQPQPQLPVRSPFPKDCLERAAGPTGTRCFKNNEKYAVNYGKKKVEKKNPNKPKYTHIQVLSNRGRHTTQTSGHSLGDEQCCLLSPGKSGPELGH